MFGLSFGTIILLGVVGILLYGERLPEVSRSFGKSFMDLRKGLNKLQSEFHSAINIDLDEKPKRKSTASYHPIDDDQQPVAPKFEPPPADPPAADHKA